MAFSPNGMFYLSSEELEPTIGLAGKGLRGMLGMPNKEEKDEADKKAVDGIIQGGDMDTLEGRNEILNSIKGVNVDAYMEFKKQFNTMETADLTLTEKRNTPTLKAEWRLDVGKKFTNRWTNANIPGQPEGITDRTALVKYLLPLVKDGTMKNAQKNDWLKAYDLEMKAKGAAYVASNAARSGKPTGLINSKDTFGDYGSSSKAKRIVAPAGPVTTGTMVTQEQYDADPRGPWSKGTPYNYKVEPVKRDEEIMPGGA